MYNLNEEQTALIAEIGKIADEVIAPAAAANDEQARFPREALDTLGKGGSVDRLRFQSLPAAAVEDPYIRHVEADPPGAQGKHELLPNDVGKAVNEHLRRTPSGRCVEQACFIDRELPSIVIEATNDLRRERPQPFHGLGNDPLHHAAEMQASHRAVDRDIGKQVPHLGADVDDAGMGACAEDDEPEVAHMGDQHAFVHEQRVGLPGAVGARPGEMVGPTLLECGQPRDLAAILKLLLIYLKHDT